MSLTTVARIASHVASAQATVDKWKARMDKDGAAYAFEWADDAMKASAKVAVFQNALTFLQLPERREAPEEAIRILIDHERDSMMSRARYPKQSTSPCSNAMHQYELAAHVELFELLSR